MANEQEKNDKLLGQEEIEANEAKEIQKFKPKGYSFSWKIVLYIIITAIAGILIIYRISPFYYENLILNSSTITYNTERKGDFGSLKITYILQATKRKINLVIKWYDVSIMPGKVMTGEIDPHRYISLFRFLENYKHENKKEKKEFPQLKLTAGSSDMSFFLSNDNINFMDKKFEIIAGKYVKRTIFPDLVRNRQMKKISGFIDPDGALAATEVLDALFYNRQDGKFVIYPLRHRVEYELGNDRFIATNFEGLGLLLEEEKDLIFWERKGLQNLTIPLSKPWTSSGIYRKVLVSRDSVYYMAPSDNNLHKLMHYDFIHRKVKILIDSTELFLKDMTPDGKYLLLVNPVRDAGYAVVEASNGKKLDADFTATPRESDKIYSFCQEPTDFMLESGGIIEIRKKMGNKTDTTRIEIPGKTLKMSAVKPDKTKILFYEQERHIYYIYDVATGNKTQVNQTPMLLINPQFSDNAKQLYFFRFDDLFGWSENVL